MFRIATLLAGVVLALPTPSSASVIYSTGFENPPYANGSQLLGQDGWTTAIPPFLNPSAATITDSVARSGLQSAQIRGADLVGSGGITAPYDAVGSYRRPFTDFPSGLPGVRVSADVRLGGPVIGSGDFVSSNLAVRANNGFVGEISLSSDGRVYGYTGNFATAGTLFASDPLDLTQWHNLAIDVDFRNRQYSFLVNGALLGTQAFDPTIDNANILSRVALVTYARPDGGGNSRSDFTFRFDNLSVVATPEPATLAVIGLVGLGAAALRRRKDS